MADVRGEKQEARAEKVFYFQGVSSELESDSAGRERGRERRGREEILFFHVWAVRVPGVLICGL